MSFLVLGRSLIQSFEATVPWVVISITDPDKPDAQITQTPLVRGVLRLEFHDCKPSSVVPGLEGISLDTEPDVVMTKEDAQRILAFVQKHIDQTELIVCQCEAGMSRSAAIAAALSRILQNEDQFFFDHYWPNQWVYQTLITSHSDFHTIDVTQI